jgi:hypothetical protein
MAAVIVLFFLLGAGLMQLRHTEPAKQLLAIKNQDVAADGLGTNGHTSFEQIVASSGRRSESVEARAVPPTTPPPPTPPAELPRRSEPVSTLASSSNVASKPAAKPPARTSTSMTATRRPIAAATAGRTGGLRLPDNFGRPAPPELPPAPSEPRRPAAESRDVPLPASAPPATVPAVTTADRAPSPAPADVPVPAVHRPEPEPRAEESAHIRSVLSRYETAYNRLDAKAASAVWPAVNQTALDRAFNGLLSQRVSLGLCDITVFGNIGGASCAGKARWEPKIGGGLQTADRYWSFNLRKTDDGWKIEEIRVR